MNLTMLCGSSSPKNSTSLYLLEALKEKLGGSDVELCNLPEAAPQDAAPEFIEALSGCDALVVAYSLYVDAIPSHLLELLQAVEASGFQPDRPLQVYQIVNCGFYEAEQNDIAVDMLWQWCKKCHMTPGCAVAVGAGPMAKVAPLGYGPSTSLGRAIDRLAEQIQRRQTGETAHVAPNYPRLLYRLQFDLNWPRLARANGLKRSDLTRRPPSGRIPT